MKKTVENENHVTSVYVSPLVTIEKVICENIFCQSQNMEESVIDDFVTNIYNW